MTEPSQEIKALEVPGDRDPVPTVTTTAPPPPDQSTPPPEPREVPADQ